MTKHDYKQTAYYILYLIRCVLQNKVPSNDKIEKMDMALLYKVAEDHSLSAIVAYALETAHVHISAFEDAKNRAIKKCILFDYEREKILAELEAAGIWYMPLKGVILKELYPRIGMRQMCDNDILFDKKYQASVKLIMQGLGYDVISYRVGCNDKYNKLPVLNFEMHHSLFSEGHEKQFYDYYNDIKNKLFSETDNGYSYRFTDEDFYIYMIVHEYKHYRDGGTGLRSLVDEYVYINKYSSKLNMSYIETELKKLGIFEFEKNQRILSKKIMCGVKLEKYEKEILDYIIFSGTYGNIENHVKNKAGFTISSKICYLFHRVFITMPQIKSSYPFFNDYKFLLPILPAYRLVKLLTVSRKRIISELKVLFG